MEPSAIPHGAAQTRNAFTRYGAALLAAAGAVSFRALLDPWLGDHLPFTTLYGAVAISVWIGGYRPALLTALLGYLACHFLFVAPRLEFAATDAATLIGLATYLVSCGIIIALCEALRTARSRSAAQQHLLEREIAEPAPLTALVGAAG